ncbi:pYEATS domain-containing protein [Caballeronia sp. KNU42]
MSLVIVFRPQVKALLLELVMRVKGGSPVEFGTFKLGSLPEQAQRIPAPSPVQPVTLRNIALLHTSFLSEEATRTLGHGRRKYYQFEVVVMAPDAVMKRIESVTYHLEDTWPKELRTRTIEDRDSRFKMKDLANGTSIVYAEVRFLDDKDPLRLNRFIDLRTDGPRI